MFNDTYNKTKNDWISRLSREAINKKPEESASFEISSLQ